MLGGDSEFWLDGQRIRPSSGETVFVPRGPEHTFRAVGGGPARHLVILTPGGSERFFGKMAAGRYRIPQDMPAIEMCARRHQITFTGPPLVDQ